MKKGKLTSVFGAIVLLAGCASSTVGPGAGAAQGVVKGSLDDVSRRAQTAFQQMNIQTTGSSMKNSGAERELTGTLGDSKITVTMDTAGNSTTNVEVAASKNIVSGNQDLARQVLSKIVQQS